MSFVVFIVLRCRVLQHSFGKSVVVRLEMREMGRMEEIEILSGIFLDDPIESKQKKSVVKRND